MSDLVISQYGMTEKNNIPLTSSRIMADKFNKQHAHILRDIASALLNFESLGQSKFGESNFIKSTYKNEQNKKQPEFLLTRDGFSYIAMGFTGKKAAEFKIAYINAFNQMESFIKDLLETKADFPEFTDAILQMHQEPKPWHFSNECNMINQIVTGMTAKQFKANRNVQGSSIRPYLTPTELEAIKKLQRFDIGLIVSVPDFQQRKLILTQQFNRHLQKLSA